MMCINAKATPTNDTDYSYHVEAVELVTNQMGSISHRIITYHQLLIAKWVDTHIHTHTKSNGPNKFTMMLQ